METKPTLLEKWSEILVHISQEEKQKLLRELAKITPVGDNSLLDWRASWSYNFDSDQIEINFHLKVQHFTLSRISTLEKVLPLFLANGNLLTESEYALDKLLKEGHLPYYLHCGEVFFLEDAAAFLRFSFSASFPNAREKYKEISTLESQTI